MRIALRIALAASAALLTLGVAQAQEKTLRIGTEGAYPPFNNLTARKFVLGCTPDEFAVAVKNAAAAGARLPLEAAESELVSPAPGNHNTGLLGRFFNQR